MPESPGKTPWPADKVERRRVENLIPYAGNARTHSPAQIGQIARSIEQFGFTIPVLVDPEGGIIAGHGRVLAAKQLGLEEVPVMVATGWSEAQRKAYVILDNKLGLNSDWDLKLLSSEIAAIKGDFTVESLGFSAGELASLLPPGPGALEPPKKAPPQSIIQFNIVFDDVAQQEAWFGFVKKLKGAYPDNPTLGARLARFIEAVADDHLPGQGDGPV